MGSCYSGDHIAEYHIHTDLTTCSMSHGLQSIAFENTTCQDLDFNLCHFIRKCQCCLFVRKNVAYPADFVLSFMYESRFMLLLSSLNTCNIHLASFDDDHKNI